MTSARHLLRPRATTAKDISRRSVLRAVMLAPGSQQVEIAATTGLSQATVSSVVQDLQREGVLRVDNPARESGSGRGNRVRLHDVHGVAAGIELGPESATVVTRRVDAPGYQSATIDLGACHPRAEWLAACERLITENLEDHGLRPADIVSIGLGIPAGVDPRTGEIVPILSTYGDLAGNPERWFQPRFPDVPVIADHHANFAAYAEYLHGAGRHANTTFYVHASTTISAGLIVNGAIVRGRHGLASQLGHLRVHPDGAVCQCGNRGCLETLVAGPRLLAQAYHAYHGYLDGTDAPRRAPQSLGELIRRAGDGDRVCSRVLRDAARTIGAAAAQACNVINPQLAVLGGDLGRAGQLVVEPATEGLRDSALSGMLTHADPCRIVTSELNEFAGARGALAYGLITDRRVAGH